ncbi:hypothetical protein EYS09_08680 [Streptomyces kasugaensis]|uniref:Uncharacterized protein n=1 Tax=Streptomyces kasugaensis TaxID=1946 RepID=A0A4Q9HXQ6_STRKA|nr:hypothetical protein [Streptomyces kasugaensis]TBO60054.1 hypothetical protein EYS09_08680 [Streptomyces kasugaensis]
MIAKRINAAAGVIARAMETRQTAAGIAVALSAAGMLQSPETAAEAERLRTQVTKLEQQVANAGALHIPHADSRHCQHDGGQWPCPTVSALGEASSASLWKRVTDALNALVATGIPVHVEPDGHISNPSGAEHIEWSRAAGRWRLVHDDETDETLLTAEQAEARRLDYRARMRAAGGDLP